MRLHIQILVAVFVGLSVMHCTCAHADDQSSDDHSKYRSVPLSSDDLREINGQVLAKEPLLSSSPGIKYADATRFDSAEDSAIVIYYPHAENAGIKHAFQVECSRQSPREAWNCEDASIRRYLMLDTQDFEVRITGPIEFDAAMAVIEGTRKTLNVSADDGIDVPDIAMMVSSFDDQTLVSWTSFEGISGVTMAAVVAEDGDPTQPDSWSVTRLNSE